jgi:hypothetical protein
MTRSRDGRGLFRNHNLSASNTSAETLIPLRLNQTTSSTPSKEKSLQLSVNEDLSTQEHSPQRIGLLGKCRVFVPLIPTTVISSLLLAGNIRSWTVPRNLYDAIVATRGSTQLAVQLIASSLGLLQVAVLCILINYSTRLKLAKTSTTLDTLQF